MEKLLSAETDVNAMKKDLIELQPKLVETGKEVEETLVIVNKETKEAEEKRKVVQGEEAIANEKATAAKAIKVDNNNASADHPLCPLIRMKDKKYEQWEHWRLLILSRCNYLVGVQGCTTASFEISRIGEITF